MRRLDSEVLRRAISQFLELDVKPVYDASVCYMMITQRDYDGIMLRFAGRCFVFASTRDNFDDSSALEEVDGLEEFDSFGIS